MAYLAPEVLKKQGHGKAVDWYLLGVVMYEMLVGIPPYYANSRDQLFFNIENGMLKIPVGMSTEAKSLLKAVWFYSISLVASEKPTQKIGKWERRCRRDQVPSFFQRD